MNLNLDIKLIFDHFEVLLLGYRHDYLTFFASYCTFFLENFSHNRNVSGLPKPAGKMGVISFYLIHTVAL